MISRHALASVEPKIMGDPGGGVGQEAKLNSSHHHSTG